MRSEVGGWVEKSRMTAWPENGLMMNMCSVEGEASIGICFDTRSSFARALIRPSGVPAVAGGSGVGREFARAGDRHLDHGGGDGGQDQHEERAERAAAPVVIPPRRPSGTTWPCGPAW